MTWTVEARLHHPQLQSLQDEQQNSYEILLSQEYLLNQKACMSHLSGLYIYITVNILQNHLRSRGRSSICEHKMVSGLGEVGMTNNKKNHIKGIFEFLWGMTDKNPNTWAVFGNFRSQSNAVSVYEVSFWYLEALFSAVSHMWVLRMITLVVWTCTTCVLPAS